MSNIIRQNIESKAREFRKRNGLGDTIPIELKSLLLNLNILTIFRPLSDDFSGMCLKDTSFSGNKYMLINSNKPKGRQHFTIAHELYHLYYDDNFSPHKCDPGLSSNKTEKYADAFAAALLMPETGLSDFIYNTNNAHVNLAIMIKIEQYYQVSRKALLVRLKELNFISKTIYDEFCELSPIKTAKEYGYDISLYNNANEGLVIGNYGEMAKTLFDKEKISEGHYLELLRTMYPETNNDPK